MDHSHRRRLLPPLAALAAVGLLVGVGVVIDRVRPAGSAGTPPVLRLLPTAGAAAELAAGGATGAARPGADAPADRVRGFDGRWAGGWGGGWDGALRLAGPLPTGPGSARVYRLGRPAGPPARMVALGRALGLRGEPTTIAGGWRLAGPTGALRVADVAGAPFEFGAVESCLTAPVCAAGCGRPPARPGVGMACAAAKTVTSDCAGTGCGPAVPDRGRTRAAAAPVLTALGLGSARVTTEPGQVSAAPSVDGRPTAGFATVIDVDAAGRVRSASGWLGTVRPGARYPVLTAGATYAALRHRPTGMAHPDLCRQRPDHRPGCAEPPPIVVTGARLGLLLTGTETGQLLVPAWLFTTAGTGEPLVGLAVVSRYLSVPSSPPSLVASPGAPLPPVPAPGPDAPTAASPGGPAADGGSAG